MSNLPASIYLCSRGPPGTLFGGLLRGTDIEDEAHELSAEQDVSR